MTTTPSRRVKVPKGYPHAGRIGLVIAETPGTVVVQVNTYCRTTMRGHRCAIVDINLGDIEQASA